ncbi:ligase-associated DNA damage response endonuclease PdeM [Jiella sp. MQZ9-1]|uniref:Ligase-associated DNA damage response endonuclease PdeM n=1 Tax=Jiella flava TaxID=2816857 RepID=A0A939FYM1_9HYPH|nr:ligase-associated DNA damage response endonuclease PdeM [Jiella flava]MBO0663960.1 ligase-associated DNA damage response endonuclease PdeM [Jiella flava]MCD2472531.1 ligase-associated DNA damage response endonuclease PdeM [Jiella flava]
MNALARRRLHEDCAAFEMALAGERIACDPSGVLFLPAENCLVVSDLHLEKGAAFARRGMFLPPYDTAATLALLSLALERYQPARVVCLGDSFHDRKGAALMPAGERATLSHLMRGRDWIWIAGNHDPEPPVGIGGETCDTVAIGALSFCHEPRVGIRRGAVSGHLHPVARLAGRGSRRACFATDGERMILPSFGVTTGGLNVLDRAFHGLFDASRAFACMIGQSGVYPVRFAALAAG